MPSETVSSDLTRITCRDKPVWFRSMDYNAKFAKQRVIMKQTDVCPLTNKKIAEGDVIYMVFSNQALFTNIMCKASRVDKLGLVEAAEAITVSYEKAKEAMNKQLAWRDKLPVEEP